MTNFKQAGEQADRFVQVLRDDLGVRHFDSVRLSMDYNKPVSLKVGEPLVLLPSDYYELSVSCLSDTLSREMISWLCDKVQNGQPVLDWTITSYEASGSNTRGAQDIYINARMPV